MLKKLLIILLIISFSIWGSDIRKCEADSTNFALPQLSKKYPYMVFIKGNPTDKKIALTFDDGPDNNITPKILNILNKKGINATFFVTGISVKNNPKILKRIYNEGHCIGNHSWSHAQYTDETILIHEITETEKIIKQITGQRTYFFRPPYGLLNEKYTRALNNMGFQIIGWNSDSYDWQGVPKNKVIANVLKHTAPGTIILQHCFNNNKLLNTVTALPEIIDQLHKKGYTFVTVKELLADSSLIVVKVNDQPINFLMADCWPQIKNNITLTPLRATFEQMGAKIDWNEPKKSIIIKKASKTINLKIGSRVAYVNNKKVLLDTPPQIAPHSNRTLVPLRFVSESLDAFIDWRVIEDRMVINIIDNFTEEFRLFPKRIIP